MDRGGYDGLWPVRAGSGTQLSHSPFSIYQTTTRSLNSRSTSPCTPVFRIIDLSIKFEDLILRHLSTSISSGLMLHTYLFVPILSKAAT